MRPVVSTFIFLLIFLFSQGDSDVGFVSKSEFNELKRIVESLQKSNRDEKKENEILQGQVLALQRQYHQIKETCDNFIFELVKTNARLKQVEKTINTAVSFWQNTADSEFSKSNEEDRYNRSYIKLSVSGGKHYTHHGVDHEQTRIKQESRFNSTENALRTFSKQTHQGNRRRQQDCKDLKNNCFYFDDEKCVGVYAPWARTNCAFRCGYCSEKPPCVDKLSYCSSLNKDDCTNPNYLGYMRTNCRQYCNLCDLPKLSTDTIGNSSVTPGPLVTGEVPHRPGDKYILMCDCYDILLNDQCFNYNDNNCYGIYAPWAKENCRLRCGFCENMQPPCVDQIPSCNLYTKSDCVKYDKWGRYTCRKFCDRCVPPTQSFHFTTPTAGYTTHSHSSGKDSTNHQVAFTVKGVVDRENLGPHQTIVFRTVITNIGGGYHQPTGVFTCKVPGVYVFYCSMVVNPNVEINLSIVKDGTDTTFAYQPIGLNQGGTMSIIHLSSGENVWVRIASHDYVGNMFSDIENSFSGFLLYPDV